MPDRALRAALPLLAAGALLSAIASLALLAGLDRARDRLAGAERARYESYLLADELRQTSDDLTRMARLYAVTGDARYRDWFREILAVRAGTAPRPADSWDIYWDLVVATGERPRPSGEPVALRALLEQAGFRAGELALLAESEARSNGLAELEEEAMDAAARGEPERARALLHGPAYHDRKAAIMRPLAAFLEATEARTAREAASREAEADRFAAALAAALGLGALLAAAAALAAVRPRRRPR